VLGFEHGVANSPQRERGNKANRILKQVNCFKFIGTICILRNIFDCICKLSTFLQNEIFDIMQLDMYHKRNNIKMEQVDYETDSVQDSSDHIDQSKGVNINCSLRHMMVVTKIRRVL
jgi:hypothetical protein